MKSRSALSRVDMACRRSSCSAGAGKRGEPSGASTDRKRRCSCRRSLKRRRQCTQRPRGAQPEAPVDRTSGIIEVEIDGVTVRVGRGAEAKTVAAVLRALKAGA